MFLTKKTVGLLMTVTFLSLATICQAQTWKVIKVLSGDEFIIESKKIAEPFSLYGIDCPEMDQPYGQQAWDLVSDMLTAPEIKVEILARGSWGRPLVVIYVDDICLNEELLQKGLAWVHDIYCKKPACYQWHDIENKVKKEGRGLWTRKNPVPPWEWRREKYRKGPPADDSKTQLTPDVTPAPDDN